MPALTRKRVNDRPETWHVHYAGVRIGVIVERSGAGYRFVSGYCLVSAQVFIGQLNFSF